MSYEYSGLARGLSGTVQPRVGTPAYLAPEVPLSSEYRGTSLIRNTHFPRITIGS